MLLPDTRKGALSLGTFVSLILSLALGMGHVVLRGYGKLTRLTLSGPRKLGEFPADGGPWLGVGADSGPRGAFVFCSVGLFVRPREW